PRAATSPPPEVEKLVWEEVYRHSYLPASAREQINRLPNTFAAQRDRFQIAALASVPYKEMEKQSVTWAQGTDDKGSRTWKLTVRFLWRDEGETRRALATVAPDGKVAVRMLD